MIKYYKTPDVIVTDQNGNARCTNGVIVLNTEFMSEESNAAALRMINALGFLKCCKMESRDRVVATPCGLVYYEIIKVVENPTEVREPSLGYFEVYKNGTLVKSVNTDGLPEDIADELYEY